ncbi:hypothetical protein [Micromonospora aurantiaca (nom. illeg.)]|uniref:hypothetical protein n=1 Tax=Micromonospora aurantiaca (nom. illeg.) TaxID=47850 RepID=UPI0033C92CCE
MTAEQHERLDDAVQQVRQRAGGRPYEEDARAYFRARDLLCVAALVRDAATPDA